MAEEIWVHIFEYLEPADLCAVAMVCRMWREVSEDSHLWQRFLPDEKAAPFKSKYVAIMQQEMALYTSSPIYLTWLRDTSYIGVLDESLVTRKVVFIGDPGVGKTSFIRACLGQPFQSQYKPTLGVDFSLLRTESGAVELWDLAGPERFSSVTRIFYKQASMALILFDMTNERTVEGILGWLKDCVEKMDTSRHRVIYMVIGCKKDRVTSSASSSTSSSTSLDFENSSAWEKIKKQCLEVAPIEGFWEVSAKDYINIEQVKEKMVSLLFGEQGERYRRKIYLPDQSTWIRMSKGLTPRPKPVQPTAASWSCVVQ